MRLNKFLAQCNLGSRRKCEELILNGLVSINGNVCTQLATRVGPSDKVCVSGGEVKPISALTYVMLNKPIGYLSSTKDQFDKPSLLKLLPKKLQHLHPVGRLDFNTQGLILLTNDGEFTNSVTHPSNKVNKTYEAVTKQKPTISQQKTLRSAMNIDGYVIKPAKVSSVLANENGTFTTTLEIHEGRNRQVRKMFSQVGLRVVSLTRVKIGNLQLGGLSVGDWKYLNKSDLAKIKG